MENLTRLEYTQALTDHGWRDHAAQLFEDGWDLGVRGEVLGEELATLIVIGCMSITDLRVATNWVNGLDRDTARRVGNLDNAELGRDDSIEAIARRLANKSGRYALKLVGTESRLIRFGRTTGVMRARVSEMSGMGQIETKDMVFRHNEDQ